jgi:hypothetical protein
MPSHDVCQECGPYPKQEAYVISRCFERDGEITTYVERFKLCVALPQDPPLEPPWSSFASLVGDELLARDRENIVELLQSPLLGFRHKEENHDECANVETCIEAECAWIVSVPVSPARCNKGTYQSLRKQRG